MADPKRYPPFVLTPAEIAFLVQKVGIAPSNQARMVAISLSESGGNIFALNNFGRDESYGLWQINMLGSMGDTRLAQLKIKDREELYDPLRNAEAMGLISGGGNNATPWSVFTSGAYIANMPRAMIAVQSPVDPTPRLNSEIKTRVDSQNSGPLQDLMNWVQSGVLRIAGFVGGGVLLILAIVLYVRSKT